MPRAGAGSSRSASTRSAWRHILSRPVGHLVWHNGGTGGCRTFTGFDAIRRIGVVVLSNVNSGVDDIGFHLLDETFPLRPPPPKHTEVAVDSLVLARYVGEYELAPRLFLRYRTAHRMPTCGSQSVDFDISPNPFANLRKKRFAMRH